VRKHVAVFVNAQMISSRSQLDIPLQPQDKVMVIQALTGG
jgi:sulfur carrier protein ThiS